MKSKFILIVALVMAIITTVLFRQYIISLDNKYKKANQIVQVVVLKADVKANQLVTKEMIELKDMSAGSLHPQALKKISEVEGKYATTDLKAGEVLFASRFTNQFTENQQITRKIRDGYRAVSIGVSETSAVTKMIQPEDYVDVICTLNDSTYIVIENIRVLAVGKSLTSVTSTGKTSETDPANYGTITLELYPQDVVNVVNADQTGTAQFVLRSKLTP
ncbi:MAG: Flp pilus assembly protein CpaB [Clostridiaceae bacterium]